MKYFPPEKVMLKHPDITVKQLLLDASSVYSPYYECTRCGNVVWVSQMPKSKRQILHATRCDLGDLSRGLFGDEGLQEAQVSLMVIGMIR